MILTQTIGKCTNCMERDPKVAVAIADTWGTSFKLKLICMECFKMKKLEGTLYK